MTLLRARDCNSKRQREVEICSPPDDSGERPFRPRVVSRPTRRFCQDLPAHVRDGQRITGMTSGQKTLPVCPGKTKFTRQENNDRGVWVSELLPHTATVAKGLCVVHSTFTEAINHDPAITYMQTGSQVPGRPSLGGLAELWTGEHEFEPSQRHRDACEIELCRTESLQSFVGHRLSSVRPSGHPAAKSGRSGAVPEQPGRCLAGRSPCTARYGSVFASSLGVSWESGFA